MTTTVASRHTQHMGRRPKEWDTWQGRLLWMIDRVVSGETTLRQLARDAGLPGESGLSVQVDRLRAGGNMKFSTVIALQAILGCSWDWLAEGKGWPTEEIRRRMGGSAPPIRAV